MAYVNFGGVALLGKEPCEGRGQGAGIAQQAGHQPAAEGVVGRSREEYAEDKGPVCIEWRAPSA